MRAEDVNEQFAKYTAQLKPNKGGYWTCIIRE